MSTPLAGLRVVVTRPADKAVELTRLLQRRGAQVIGFPTIVIADPPSWEQVDSAGRRLRDGDYAWVVFTSVNAVDKFVGRVGGEILAATKVAAVGDATRAALKKHGIEVSLVPSEYTGSALAEALGQGDGTILLPRVEGAPRRTVDALEEKGWTIDEVVTYRNIVPEKRSSLPDFDVVTFASGSAARNFASLVDLEKAGLNTGSSKLVACIGPSTAEAARLVGLEVDVVADVHTDEGLVAALMTKLIDDATD